MLLSTILPWVNLVLVAILLPAGIFMARSLVREEIAQHDGHEYAHSNLIGMKLLEKKIDDLSVGVRMDLTSLTNQIAALREELAREEGRANGERAEAREDRKTRRMR